MKRYLQPTGTELTPTLGGGDDFSSSFAGYMLECYSAHIINYGWGFLVYDTSLNYLNIHDFYVRPNSRLMGNLSLLVEEAEKIATQNGLSYIGGKLSAGHNSFTQIVEIAEHLGFERAQVKPEYIFYMRRI